MSQHQGHGERCGVLKLTLLLFALVADSEMQVVQLVTNVPVSRFFLTSHMGFGRFAAWQFWFEVARLTLPATEDMPPEVAAEAGQPLTAALLSATFQRLWKTLKV